MKRTIACFVFLSLLFLGAVPARAVDPCDLTGSDVQNCDYSGRDFFNFVLNGKNMSGTNLSSLIARFSYWENTNLNSVNAESANFYFSDMIGANFTAANLTNAIFTNTNLDNADFTDATLTGVFSGSITGTPAALPSGWKVTAGHLVGPGANLSNADLSGADLAGVDLRGANLNGIRSGGITGNPQLPEKWQLVGGYLFGPGANLSYARLDGIAIWGSDFTNVNLTGASVNGTGFIYPTSFEGVKSGGIVGVFQYGPKLVNGYIVEPKVNLEGADLQGADLSNLDLADSNLRGADLTGAELDNTNLAGANLVNADFTEADLYRANLRECEIRNTKFNRAILRETLLGNNQIISSEFYGTVFSDTEFINSELRDSRSGGITGSYLNDGNFVILDGEIFNLFNESSAPMLGGQAMVGETVTVSTELIQPPLSTLSIQWLRNGSEISGATDNFYVIQREDFGKKLSVRLTLSKPGYISSSDVSPEVSVFPRPMGLGVVRISGKAKVGVSLKAQASAWAPGAKASYQWLRNGKAIKGATKSSYKAVAADKGKKLAVKITQQSTGYLKSTRMSSSITIR